MLTSNIWVSALIISILVTILVFIHTPKVEIPGYETDRTAVVVKSFVISYAVCAGILYFTGGKDNAMSYMLEGEPTF